MPLDPNMFVRVDDERDAYGHGYRVVLSIDGEVVIREHVYATSVERLKRSYVRAMDRAREIAAEHKTSLVDVVLVKPV